ncbi:uncharacterized protein LOC131143825 [Malania oleifera]|uniref:uncharacterized protein LOC131143825 n=1 Tax=Malania oleifera TaxID=397392 RepID=UPI0025AECAAB|nr:uncharacterized protein LOC131143825 [Malania oleifera]
MGLHSLAIILKENKLVRSNYIDWKWNLIIVLTAEEYKYVLVEVCTQKPSKGATDEEPQAYWKWIKVDEMTQCYILASMSNVLQHQHQFMPSAYDIMQNLKEIFGDQNRTARHTAMKELMNYGRRGPKILGVEIDGEIQVDIVLQSLPDSFKQFFLNYNVNKLSYSLEKLLKELQAVEGLIRKPTNALVIEKGRALEIIMSISLPDSFKQFFLNYNVNKLSYSLEKLLKELQAVEGLIRKPTNALVIEKGSSSSTKGQKKQKKV